MEDAVTQFISQRINFERLPAETYGLTDFKLERMRSLLSRLGDPQQGIPAIHIAGTKGKGSTAAMAAAILRTSGRRVGLYTSPHIEHFSERMTVNGRRPSADERQRLLDMLQPVVAEMDELTTDMRPSFFEVLTAMAWLHFQQRAVDLVVLETGLGGRLDATNVCAPLLCVVTSISRDHERLLGSSLSAIAREKAGIIKPGVPVISGVLDAEPRDVIRKVAGLQKAPLTELHQDICWEEAAVTQRDPSSTTGLRHHIIRITTPHCTHAPMTVPLAGEHQANNLALAVAAVDSLSSRDGWDIPESAIQAGLSELDWPLRVEVVHQRPLVIVDAAHNVASIDALLETLKTVTASRRLLIFSSARDKDTAGMLSRLSKAFDRVILTRFVGNPRAVTRADLESMADSQLSAPWTWADNPKTACQLAMQDAQPNDLICATGSFFLAAEFSAAVRAMS